MQWKYPSPFVSQWNISQDHIDHYNHVNNVAYLSRLEKLAWEHSNSLGLHFSQYQKLDRGMVIRRHELNYIKPLLLGDNVMCATWITQCDGRLQLTREFEFVNQQTGAQVFTATTHFVCISLSTGAPKRMPQLFSDTYTKACISNQAHLA